jgi:Pregnancy-associated plasma protein-A
MKYVLVLILSLGSLLVRAQSEFRCPSDSLQKALLEHDDDFKQRQDLFESDYRHRVKNPGRSNGVVYTLPIVYHIMHSGEPVGSEENPGDAIVIDRNTETNEDFRHNYTGAPDYDNPFYGADTEIEFCLASVDDQGNATNGIVRHYAPYLAMGSTEDLAMWDSLDTYAWDKSKYVNVFLLDLTNAGGVSWGLYDFIIDDIYQFQSESNGACTNVHELGHYLNLDHTFNQGNYGSCANDDCLLDGDKVCDTPPKFDSEDNDDCENPENSCFTDADDTSTNNPYRPVSMGGLGDQEDMYDNYMDYTFCCAAFTEGQKVRMRTDIETYRMSQVDHAAVACGVQIAGCTDPDAHNYDADATVDNGSCETCDDGIQNGDEAAVDCGGTICGPCDVYGCTNPDAHNYNANATVDDGSCETCDDGIQNGDETGVDCGGDLCDPCYESCDDISDISAYVVCDVGMKQKLFLCPNSADNGSFIAYEIPGIGLVQTGNFYVSSCWSPYNWQAADEKLMPGDIVIIRFENGCDTTLIIDFTESCDPDADVPGCTDPEAHNYNANATVDDGSCETCDDGVQNGDETGVDCGGALCDPCPVYGCTDSSAHNYNPDATADDGSCETCSDGVQNGDEEGIDCGGVLCEPCGDCPQVAVQQIDFWRSTIGIGGQMQDVIYVIFDIKSDEDGLYFVECDGCEVSPGFGSYNDDVLIRLSDIEVPEEEIVLSVRDAADQSCISIVQLDFTTSTDNPRVRQLDIFPVPVNSNAHVTIDLGLAREGKGNIMVYDQNGATVRHGKCDISPEGTCRLSMEGLASSVYYVTIFVDGVGYVGKIVVL